MRQRMIHIFQKQSKRFKIDSDSESESNRDTNSECDVSQRNPSTINLRSRVKFGRNKSDTSISDHIICSDLNYSI